MILQTIKRRWKLLLLLFAVMCSACVFAACGEDDPTPQELGYTVQVVYDANGGSFTQTSDTPNRYVFYKPGSPIIRPAYNNGVNALTVPTMAGYHLAEWYPAVLDDEGEPLKNEADQFVDESGASIFEGEPWDFEQKLPKEGLEKLYLVASWDDNYVFTIDVGDEARAEGVDNYVDNGYETEGNVFVPYSLPSWPGHSIRYFTTEDGRKIYKAEEFTEFYLSEQTPSVTVKVEWLEGTWNVLSSPEDFEDIDSYTDLWLDTDIDMAGGDISFAGFNGEFNGNGHTISNAIVSDATSLGNIPENFGVFSFSGDGFMHDVRFENVTYNVSIGLGITTADKEPEYFNVGLISADGSEYDLTKFTGLVFIGCKLNITLTMQKYSEKLNYGEGTSYEGIFGVLGAEQTFTPAEGSEPVTVKVIY